MPRRRRQFGYRGNRAAAAAEVAAYRTRDAKDYGVDPDRRRAEWVSRAAEFGLDAASIAEMVEEVERREPLVIEASDLQLALTDLEERHSHFDRREMLSVLANRLREGADTETLEDAIDSLLSSSRVKEIYRGPDLLSPTYYTTPRIWELEQGFIERARDGAEAGAAVVDRATLSAVLERHRYLSAEQVEMVRRLSTGGERIVAVAALPGAGKTTALGVAREAWAAAGIRGIGLANARSASGQLGEAAGMPATSITDFLIRIGERIDRGLEPLPPGTVIVVDEASTASTPYLAVLAELAEDCEGKLILIGDSRQIGAVGPGGLFGHLTDEVAPIRLTEIRRQHDPLDRHIVKLAHEGRGSDALDVLAMKERFVVADTMPEALDAQALDWRRRFVAGEDAVMIARRNRDVAALNERARELLASEGKLGERALMIGGRPFAAGDRVITRVNTAKVSNRERWDVVEVDVRGERLRLRRLDEESGVVLDRHYLDRMTKAGEPALQHAYALTTYATQSKTFDSAFALLDTGISSEDFTVAISRARGPVIAYASAASELTDSDLGPEEPETEDPMHDLRIGVERTAAEYAASEIALWGEVMQRAPADLASRRAELEGRQEMGKRPTPAEKRLGRLRERIGEVEARLTGLAAEREGLRAETNSDPERLSRVEADSLIAARQLERMEEARDDLSTQVSAQAISDAALTGTERAELSMIEDRMKHLHRRQVVAERIQPSRIVEESLGKRPGDPEAAALWSEGVDAIHTFRQRYGITATSGHPLGPDSGDAPRRAERRRVEARLEQVRVRLGRQQERRADRELDLSR
jgi:hypothetical protein